MNLQPLIYIDSWHHLALLGRRLKGAIFRINIQTETDKTADYNLIFRQEQIKQLIIYDNINRQRQRKQLITF